MGGQLFEGTRRDVFYLLPEEVVIIGLDTKDGREHPLWDARIHLPVTDADVADVLTHGILEPGLIRKENLEKGVSRAVVLNGRQRVKWARAANARLREQLDGAELEKKLIRVPFLPKQAVGDAAAQMRMGVVANSFKPSDYMMKAEEASRMHERGISLKDIAADFRVSEQAVSQWLQVLNLGTKAQEAVRSGVWKPSTAIQYSDLSEEKQNEILAEMERLGVSISSTEAKAQRAKRARNGGNGNGNGHEVRRPMSVGIVRKVVAHERFDELEPEVKAVLKCIAGEPNQDRRVKLLRGILKDVGWIEKDAD